MLRQFLRRVLEVNTELLNQMKELIIMRVGQLGRRNPTTSAPSEHGAGGLSEEPCRTTGSVFDGCVLDYHDTNADLPFINRILDSNPEIADVLSVPSHMEGEWRYLIVAFLQSAKWQESAASRLTDMATWHY